MFDLRTANSFGLMIWCIFLAFHQRLLVYTRLIFLGVWRGTPNYVYSHVNPTLPDPNIVGGNFYGGGSGELQTLMKSASLLQLRLCRFSV